jgi:hypothetical protein
LSKRFSAIAIMKFHREALVGRFVESRPKQVNVIGHQHIGGTRERIARARVNEGKLPRVMEGWCQPARGAVFERERPVDERAAPVEFGGEAGEVAFGLGRGGHSLVLAATGWFVATGWFAIWIHRSGERQRVNF